MPRGRPLDVHEIQKIESLLISTDMTLRQIAERMSCSHSAVMAVNRKTKARRYPQFHADQPEENQPVAEA
jgi:hypothetical protein